MYYYMENIFKICVDCDPFLKTNKHVYVIIFYRKESGMIYPNVSVIISGVRLFMKYPFFFLMLRIR